MWEFLRKNYRVAVSSISNICKVEHTLIFFRYCKHIRFDLSADVSDSESDERRRPAIFTDPDLRVAGWCQDFLC